MIYLDNAATTPMLPEVVDVITSSMLTIYGNPSSIHQAGKKAKALVESSRKEIAKLFNVTSSEIVFTSGGTEANNFILYNAVVNLGVSHIVTSKIEHHAVLNVVLELERVYNIKVSYVKLDEFGQVDLQDLNNVLALNSKNTLVSLMMVNNEIGNLLPINEVAAICKTNKVLFHSDTVQAIGHYHFNLQELPVDFITASAHKFHGPKGVGFAYIKKGYAFKSFLQGGGQERGLRSGTENIHAILGMTKAITIAYEQLQENEIHLKRIKLYFINAFKKYVPDIAFNGLSASLDKSSNTILNVRFPFTDKMFLLKLDLNGVCASAGSACQSGASNGSHVLKEILQKDQFDKSSVRFSFSKLTKQEYFEALTPFF